MNQFQASGTILLCLAVACDAQIRVNLYNDASVSDGALAVAQKEADRILKEAGVTLSWCRWAAGASVPCNTPGPATVQVRLYPRGAESNFKVPDNSLGVALTSPAPEFGFFVGVFAARITERTGGYRSRYGLTLGHVIAHELGHLLLERSAHSRDGLMKDDWDNSQWDQMASGRLLFVREEAKLIQERVKMRQQMAAATSDGR